MSYWCASWFQVAKGLIMHLWKSSPSLWQAGNWWHFSVASIWQIVNERLWNHIMCNDFKLNQHQLCFVRATDTLEFVAIARQKRKKKDTKLQKAPEPTLRDQKVEIEIQTLLKQSWILQNKGHNRHQFNSSWEKIKFLRQHDCVYKVNRRAFLLGGSFYWAAPPQSCMAATTISIWMYELLSLWTKTSDKYPKCKFKCFVSVWYLMQDS